ncbi:MAG TPA: RDD family protein, partial [Steroidobacteraceae bacterium]|nr:RDD family protein [Steroidobacteraceae bacterium]
YFWRQIGLVESDAMFAGTADVLLNYVLPAIAIILFWIARAATPGKMALSMKIVDADTLGPMSKGQAIGRYLSYYLSMFGLMLGFLWVAFDPRKQGWHDKLAGTVVIRTRGR